MEITASTKLQLPAYNGNSSMPLPTFLSRTETTVAMYKGGTELTQLLDFLLQRPATAKSTMVPSYLQGPEWEGLEEMLSATKARRAEATQPVVRIQHH